MKTRTVEIMLNALEAHERSDKLMTVRQTGGFGNEADNIKAEAVNALFKPPVDHIVKVAAQVFVFPVEVHLLFAEKVKRPLLFFRIIIPCTAGED